MRTYEPVDRENRLLTVAEMRALEAEAMQRGLVSGAVLMERASIAVVDAILRTYPEFATSPGKARVLCGPGNNGGDGYGAAFHLARRGWDVDCVAIGAVDKLPPDAAAMRQRWLSANVSSRDGSVDLLVDAVFGIGVTRPLDPSLEAAMAVPARVHVAVDLPSGLDGDTGRWWGQSERRADLTVTFQSRKCGHVLGEGLHRCGKVVVAPLFTHRESAVLAPAGLTCVGPAFDAATLPPDAHKYQRGHAMVFAGGVGRGGAARLAARAALRVGAGLVTVAPPPSALIENAARLDAIMLRSVRDAQDATQMLLDTRIKVMCLGPGFGVSDRERDIADVALESARPLVLDADGLTLLARCPETLSKKLHPNVVLTPHAGEFARLFPDLDLQAPIEAVQDAAARAGCTVLLKGPVTLIAGPESTCAHLAVGKDAAPWLGTAGAGDVLAGLITGLLARGFTARKATEMAVWIHAACAREIGPGLIAEDLPDAVPSVFKRLERGS